MSDSDFSTMAGYSRDESLSKLILARLKWLKKSSYTTSSSLFSLHINRSMPRLILLDIQMIIGVTTWYSLAYWKIPHQMTQWLSLKLSCTPSTKFPLILYIAQPSIASTDSVTAPTKPSIIAKLEHYKKLIKNKVEEQSIPPWNKQTRKNPISHNERTLN